MHLSPPAALAVVCSKAVVLLLLLLNLWDSVIVLCIIEESWLLCFVCLACCVSLPRDAMGLSAVCVCGMS